MCEDAPWPLRALEGAFISFTSSQQDMGSLQLPRKAVGMTSAAISKRRVVGQQRIANLFVSFCTCLRWIENFSDHIIRAFITTVDTPRVAAIHD
jgi:hypothetical protein